MTKKKFYNEIKKYAKILPVTYTVGNCNELVENYDFIKLKIIQAKTRHLDDFSSLDPEILSEKPFKIEKKKDYVWPVNHERRMIKAYEQSGIDGVKKYVEWVDKNNRKINGSIESQMAIDLVKHNLSVLIL